MGPCLLARWFENFACAWGPKTSFRGGVGIGRLRLRRPHARAAAARRRWFSPVRRRRRSRSCAPAAARRGGDRPGAGTGLAGGCTAHRGGVVLSLARMNRVLEIDLRNRMAVVEPGVANVQLPAPWPAAATTSPPTPSSQGASTIGGNVATNAGGPHTLRYGVTVNHLLGLEAVLSSGAIVQLGPAADPAKLDLAGVLCGSEGTLGVVTKVWVRLTPDPQDDRTVWAVFNSVDDAAGRGDADLAAGIIPAAMELWTRASWRRSKRPFTSAFRPDAAAVLVIEVDGFSDQPRRARPEAAADRRVLPPSPGPPGRRGRHAGDAAAAVEVPQLASFIGAMGRLSPSYIIQDGVVPRTQLPHMLRRIAEIGRRHQVRIVNVAHAGDGNVHPILLFDERDRDQVDRALAAGRRIAPRVHRLRRQHHRRARRRHRKARPDGPPVRAGRPGGHAAGAAGLGSARAAQSRAKSCRKGRHRAWTPKRT